MSERAPLPAQAFTLVKETGIKQSVSCNVTFPVVTMTMKKKCAKPGMLYGKGWLAPSPRAPESFLGKVTWNLRFEGCVFFKRIVWERAFGTGGSRAHWGRRGSKGSGQTEWGLPSVPRAASTGRRRL